MPFLGVKLDRVLCKVKIQKDVEHLAGEKQLQLDRR